MNRKKKEKKSRVFIVTVGLSVIINYKKEKKCEIIDEEDLLNYLLNNYRVNPNITSAEIKTLKLLKFNPLKDFVYLLTTDTTDGKKAGRYIEAFFMSKLKLPGNRVITLNIPGLQIEDAARFLNEGARNLMNKIKQIKDENINKGECIIISTGGFKSVLPILSDAGKKFQLELKYVFEHEDEIIGLPPNRDKFYENLKEPHYVTLAKELIKARFTNFDFSSGCHPTGFQQVPPDSLYLDEFKKKGGRESYKALYYIAPSDIEKIKADNFDHKQMDRRFIRVNTMKKIFEEKIKLSTKLEADERVQLPMAPGMLFIICLVEFCEEMRIEEIELYWQANDERQGSVVMEMGLKDSVRFKHGIFTSSGGKGIELFRKLLACRSETVLNNANEKQREEILFHWPPQPLPEGTEGHSTIYPRIIDWEITKSSGKLKLWWHSNKKKKVSK